MWHGSIGFTGAGRECWSQLDDVAKFASTGAGHARAQLFADAMLGDVSKRELVQRITKKRYQAWFVRLGCCH